MLRISKMADYGTVIMVYLANETTLTSVSDIAKATRLGKATVSKLVKRLAKADLLHSERGTKGGYRLKRHMDTISVADIIAAIEDKQGLTECSDSNGDCLFEPYCHIKGHWQIISQTVEEALKKVTLKTLASPLSKRQRNEFPIEKLQQPSGDICGS